MALTLTSAPGAEPLSLAEARAQLRLDSDEEDQLLAALITAARLWIERSFGLALITQTWSLFLDRWPEGAMRLPLFPVQSVGAVTVHGQDGDSVTVDSGDYVVDLASRPARLLFTAMTFASLRRLNAIEVAFTAGFGDAAADVPAPIRQALLLLIAHWYEMRTPVIPGYEPPSVPAMVEGLLAPYRDVRL